MNTVDKYQIANIPSKLYLKNTKSSDRLPNILGNKFDQIINAIHKSEDVGISAAANKADLHSLVTSFSVAETNLRVLTTINEKFMASLQDIVKMQI